MSERPMTEVPTSPKDRNETEPGPVVRLLLVAIWESPGCTASNAYIVTCKKLFDANITIDRHLHRSKFDTGEDELTHCSLANLSRSAKQNCSFVPSNLFEGCIDAFFARAFLGIAC